MGNFLTENQLYNKNISLFKGRFLELYKIIEKSLGKLPENIEIISCKADSSKQTAKYNNQFMHSAYNPEREAEKLLQNERRKIKTQKEKYSITVGIKKYQLIMLL